MQQYLDLVRNVLEEGEEKGDRTGTGTISIFGTQTKYDLRDGFPLVTTKKVRLSNIVRELLWFLKGSTNIHDGLHEYTKIWDEWSDKDGNLGPIYGYQWTQWEKFVLDEETNMYRKEHINQIAELIHTLKTNPNSRRMIVSAWNVADVEKMALPPCHTFFQVYVTQGRLDLQLYQRSADLALGVPYNIASYSLLLTMLAQEVNLVPGIFTHTIGDAHIYTNHIEGLREQLKRDPLPLPTLHIEKKPFWDITFEDIVLENYVHHDTLRFPIAV